MLLIRGFSLMLKWSVRAGLIILRGMVEVAIRRSFRGALRMRSNSDEESGNSTSPETIGGGVEVGPGRTSGQPRRSSKESKNSQKMED